ncbi:MAG: tetratricopeptide repeat protein [Terriglobia bacterium]
MIPARRWLPAAILVGLVAGYALLQLQKAVDRYLEGYRTEVQILYLPSGEWVKRLSLGYHGLAACLYWTRAVQHYGRENLSKRQYKLLYPLLDITTTVDPELILAYRFGAIFLAEPQPMGPGRPHEAIALLRKGLKQNPNQWRLWYDMGFVYYRALKDYPRASEAFLEGSKNPDSMYWMQVMAAKIAAEGGNRPRARFLWQKLLESTDDPTIRGNAIRYLQGLQVDDEVEILEALVKRYREQTGRQPHSFVELLGAGLLRALPRDPLEYPYQLTPDGRVLLHRDSPIITSTKGRAQ